MLTLQRITSEYIAAEDRFRLRRITDRGGEVCYWMTQRLRRRLLDFLLDWLETHREELERHAAAETPGPMAAKPARAGAKAAREPPGSGGEAGAAGAGETPEEGKAAAAELLYEADIRIAATRVTVVFKPKNSEHAQFSLQLDEAWRWVAILHTLWKRAEWSLSAWPDWVEDIKRPYPAKSRGYLH